MINKIHLQNTLYYTQKNENFVRGMSVTCNTCIYTHMHAMEERKFKSKKACMKLSQLVPNICTCRHANAIMHWILPVFVLYVKYLSQLLHIYGLASVHAWPSDRWTDRDRSSWSEGVIDAYLSRRRLQRNGNAQFSYHVADNMHACAHVNSICASYACR